MDIRLLRSIVRTTIFVFASLLFITTITAEAQSRQSIIRGTIVDENNLALPSAMVMIEGTNVGIVSDLDGRFTLKTNLSGAYTLVFSYVGYEASKKALNLPLQKVMTVDVKMKTSHESIDEVVVLGKSTEQKRREEPLKIEVISTKDLQAQSIDVTHALKQTTGIVVRQQGGLGSSTNININGLTGNAVRMYYDDIPLELYGGGIQINNIPVDAIENVEVYKGIIPVDVGTDALGGGVNLISAKEKKDNLRVGYSYGSFNTHRANFSAHKNMNDHFSLSALGFFNHSDNDYTMRRITNMVNLYEEETIDAKRFHSAHTSGFANIDATFNDILVADQLRVSAMYSQRYDQRQHGAVLSSVAYGEADGDVQNISGRLDIKKTLLDDRLKLRYFGVYSHADNSMRDSTKNTYNWKGEIIDTTGSGSEVSRFPTLRKGTTTGMVHRATVNYNPIKNWRIVLSNFYRDSKVVGEDPIGTRLFVNNQSIDPNTIPSKLKTNIFGAEIGTKFLKEKLDAIAFYKNYYYNSEAVDIYTIGNTSVSKQKVKDSSHGYGFGLKYTPFPELFFRASYERTMRLPREMEIFGNYSEILPNYNIRPELSDNLNIGVNYSLHYGYDKYLSLQVDGFIRNRKDLIRSQLAGDSYQFVNEAAVDGLGAELSIKIEPLRDLMLNLNVTKQSSLILTDNEAYSADKLAEVPNIPNFYANAIARYNLSRLLENKLNLALDISYNYIDRYSINEVYVDLDEANQDFIVPRQHLLTMGIVYVPSYSNVSFGFTINNVLNSLIYDNFKVPRPGTNCSLKISYKLN